MKLVPTVDAASVCFDLIYSFSHSDAVVLSTSVVLCDVVLVMLSRVSFPFSRILKWHSAEDGSRTHADGLEDRRATVTLLLRAPVQSRDLLLLQRAYYLRLGAASGDRTHLFQLGKLEGS